ncbi:MAG: HD domain-containing protein [Lachnospiraceae bacterium]|nr:HD domain-containing protein [Lachnospiraceae bacterium]
MKLSFSDLLGSISYALDCVEHDLLGVTTYHSKRVAYLSVLLGKEMGMSDMELVDLAACAVLHDNALTEFVQEEYQKGIDVHDNEELDTKGQHCSLGERNVKDIPFHTNVENVVLYHHENADGTGAFGKMAVDTPMMAQLIHMADHIDAYLDLSFVDQKKYEKLLRFVRENEDVLFSRPCVESFRKIASLQMMQDMEGAKIDVLLAEQIPFDEREYTDAQIKAFATVFARIIDYKSNFTMHHSLGIAAKAEQMGHFYGYDPQICIKLYFAGAMHDIGKLVVDRDVLEKPAKLTEEEFKHIQNHAFYTYDILRKVHGLEDITSWASLHHEKLNGKGYPFGKTASELGHMERLMACIDIYQALTEDRPYKEGMSHEASMNILHDMVENGFIDGSIVSDLHTVFGTVS